MQVSTRLSSAASGRFDWTRPHTRDALVLLAISVVTFGAAHFFDLPPYLLQFGLDHADWEMDDLIFVTFMLSIAMMIYGVPSLS